LDYYFLYFFDGGGGSLVTGSVAGSFCFLWGCIHRPAAAAACQSFFYDFYKKLTELSANNFRLLFCWLVGAQLPVSIVPLPLGVVAAEIGGEPAPEIQIDPVAFVSQKTHRRKAHNLFL
jgi:hypothetical protein